MRHEFERLASQQQKLVDTIFLTARDAESSPLSFQRGIAVYRNNLLSTAARSLSVTFPVIAKLLGENVMKSLAKMMLENNRPSTGDWADWGESLPVLLQTTPLMDDYPFLQDVARLEWFMHESGRNAASSVGVEVLARLQNEDLMNLVIQVSPIVKILESEFPLDCIWLSHQTDSEKGFDSQFLENAIASHGEVCRLIIYQENQVPKMERLPDVEFEWFMDVQKKCTLHELFDRYPDFNFIHWFTEAVEKQWITDLH